MTDKEAHELYRKYANQFVTYTSSHPMGTNIIGESWGRQEYIFRDQQALASFLDFVLKERACLKPNPT